VAASAPEAAGGTRVALGGVPGPTAEAPGGSAAASTAVAGGTGVAASTAAAGGTGAVGGTGARGSSLAEASAGWWGAPYPYYYGASPVVVQPAPTEYIQQAPAPPAQTYWYYCQNAGAYYPYVKDCPGGWMQVVPQPAPPGP
jgi:hypothetical protein